MRLMTNSWANSYTQTLLRTITEQFNYCVERLIELVGMVSLFVSVGLVGLVDWSGWSGWVGWAPATATATTTMAAKNTRYPEEWLPE